MSVFCELDAQVVGNAMRPVACMFKMTGYISVSKSGWGGFNYFGPIFFLPVVQKNSLMCQSKKTPLYIYIADRPLIMSTPRIDTLIYIYGIYINEKHRCFTKGVCTYCGVGKVYAYIHIKLIQRGVHTQPAQNLGQFISYLLPACLPAPAVPWPP